MIASPLHLGLVGIGKIARDQHLPAIAGNDRFILSAAASRHPFDPELIRYATLDEMLAGEPGLDAVSICTPPRGRHLLAAEALRAGKHVMIEKPPGATVSEVIVLADLAREAGRTLFATWHSRHAAGVADARAWLADKTVLGARIFWEEDVRVWHPGQDWIFKAGGLGVFDPAINALSILTTILPQPLILEDAELAFPENRQAPIAGTLAFRHGEAAVAMQLDFLHEGEQRWDIIIETDAGTLQLSRGGAVLTIDSKPVVTAEDHEYAGLYARFAELIDAGRSDVDLRPLQLVADAFIIGSRRIAPSFSF
jgi:predicted dehydrogenase